jgi:sorting nexin-8
MKPGWEAEVDKLQQAIDADNATIKSLLERRVMIKACMWHELAVVLHSRQAAQVTLGWREFVQGEVRFGDRVKGVWEGLAGRLEEMPLE